MPLTATVQLRLKEIAGGALLHADKDSGLAALIIPMRMPLRLFRLEDKKNDKGAVLGLTCLCIQIAHKPYNSAIWGLVNFAFLTPYASSQTSL